MSTDAAASTAGALSIRPQRPRSVLLDRLAERFGLDVRLPASPSGEPGDLDGLLGLDGLAASGVTLDSRDVRPGDLYVGMPGARRHGAEFAAQAAASGAVAMLTDETGAGIARDRG
ncbi:MAG: Mur ligase domain-containing protein, partial [Leucobacter sp.]